MITKNLSTEEMKQFVEQNMDKIPARSVEKFNEMDVEKQYKRMKWYVKHAAEKKLYEGLNKTCRQFAVILFSGDMTMADADKMLELLNNWIEEHRADEIKRIDEEIARLTSMKNELTK